MVKIFKREFLLGLGAGFIISGIMVSVFGIGTLSDEEIAAKAAKLGMVRPQSPKTTQSPQTTQTTQSPQSPQTTQSPQSPQTTQSPQSSLSSQTTQSSQNQPQTAGPEKPAANVVVEIKPGMGSETIARLLEEKGVVKDRKEFYKLVTVKKAHAKFRVGKFTVPVGGDMEQILKMMTGK